MTLTQRLARVVKYRDEHFGPRSAMIVYAAWDERFCDVTHRWSIRQKLNSQAPVRKQDEWWIAAIEAIHEAHKQFQKNR